MKKILIVEDDDAISTGLKYYLEGEDFDIVLANNGAIALTELDKNNDISLILLDINLPDIGGFDLFKKRKNKGRNWNWRIFRIEVKSNMWFL